MTPVKFNRPRRAPMPPDFNPWESATVSAAYHGVSVKTINNWRKSARFFPAAIIPTVPVVETGPPPLESLTADEARAAGLWPCTSGMPLSDRTGIESIMETLRRDGIRAVLVPVTALRGAVWRDGAEKRSRAKK